MSHPRNWMRRDDERRHDARAGGPRAATEPRGDASLRARKPAGSRRTADVDRPSARPMAVAASREAPRGPWS